MVELGAVYAGIAVRAAIDLQTTAVDGRLFESVMVGFQRSFAPLFLGAALVVLLTGRAAAVAGYAALPVALAVALFDPAFHVSAVASTVGVPFGLDGWASTVPVRTGVLFALPASVFATIALHRLLVRRAAATRRPPANLVRSRLVALGVTLLIVVAAGTCEATTSSSAPVGTPSPLALAPFGGT